GDFESLDADAFGPGDLLLRAKYRFLDRNTWGLAAGLTLHFPTGNEDNFQSIGDTVVTPSIVASWQSARWDVHGSFGVDIKAGDLDRSGVRYGVGASFAVLERLTLLADVVGTSGFASQDITFFVAAARLGRHAWLTEVVGPGRFPSHDFSFSAPAPRLLPIRGKFHPPVQARAVGNGT